MNNNQLKEDQNSLMGNSLFKWEHIKMMRYIIENKNKEFKEINDSKDKEFRDRSNFNKEKLKFGLKNL